MASSSGGPSRGPSGGPSAGPSGTKPPAKPTRPAPPPPRPPTPPLKTPPLLLKVKPAPPPPLKVKPAPTPPPKKTKRRNASVDSKTRRVSFLIPDEIASVEVAVIEPKDSESSSDAQLGPVVEQEVEPPEPPLPDHLKGVNCYFVNQKSHTCLKGRPLADMWFAMFSMLLLMTSNALLVHNCVWLFKRQDIRFTYVLAFLVVERLMAAVYRCWSASRRGCLQIVANTCLALVYLDTFATAISLVCTTNGSYKVNLSPVKGAMRSKKQWTALPFLSAPARLVTRMKMMCLLSAGAQSWQIVGILAGVTDNKTAMTQPEFFKIVVSIACSTTFVCWAVTCSLPTRPVPVLYNSGYCIVLRTALKMCWLLCIAASRITAFYVFSEGYHYKVFALAGGQWLLVLLYSLLVKCCSARGVSRPSFVKLLVVSSVYVFVFVHPQKNHLDHGYGLFYFFYLGENLVILYSMIDVYFENIRLVFISVGFYSAGILLLLILTILNMFVSHQSVQINREEPVWD